MVGMETVEKVRINRNCNEIRPVLFTSAKPVRSYPGRFHFITNDVIILPDLYSRSYEIVNCRLVSRTGGSAFSKGLSLQFCLFVRLVHHW